LESFLSVLGSVGAWSGTVLWALAMGVACLAILLALPGGWVALGLALVYDALTGFQSIGVPMLVVFAVLLGVGEAAEALLGSVYVAAKGATRWGVIGAFVGGILGAVLGSLVIPLLGTFLGGFAGAFAGAVSGEYFRDRKLEPSLRVGFHATVGRFVAVTVKGLLATTGAYLVAAEAIRHLVAGAP
jgi:uncharacterized protein YqgC (DUF456 family)